MAPPSISSSLKLHLLVALLPTIATPADTDGFLFNGFVGANLTLDALATITQSGLLMLTNNTVQHKGHAFFPVPFPTLTPQRRPNSFSTSFVFAITSEYPKRLSGHGIAFVASHDQSFAGGLASQYLGLFNASNNGNATNRVVAVELDTIQSSEFKDIDGNHVGIDVNGLVSNQSHTAGYYPATGSTTFVNLSLISGEPMLVQIEYDGASMQLDVTLSPIDTPKPRRPLLSAIVNLPSIVGESIYVGFSSSTGSVLSSHYILGWSFQMNGKPRELDFRKLPKVPKEKWKRRFNASTVWISLATAALVLLTVATVAAVVRWRIKYAEIFEDWEIEYGPRRFRYRDLHKAAKGFGERELLGFGGFGRVYKGVLPGSGQEVAIKKITHHGSRDGLRGFIAEIASMGRLSHRNLVQLLGYCRRKGELLLVYEFMPNGSLDKRLFAGSDVEPLDWPRRFHVIKGVAAALLYLHEDWEKLVIHRDVKASNVLLDGEMNAKLGDFGLARLHDHGSDPHTSMVVGTMGYLAPELTRTGRATTATDVFAFGAFLLEVACGRRPIEQRTEGDEMVLVDWVAENWRRGALVEARDPGMGNDYTLGEVEMVLHVGLLCSNTAAAARPCMRQVMRYLEGELPPPELPKNYLSEGILDALLRERTDDCVLSFPSSISSEPFVDVSREGAVV